MNNLGRTIAYVALAGALFATAVTLDDRPYPAGEARKGGPSLGPGGRDAELARCRAIGVEDADDAGCRAVWQANRKRFLQSGKPDRDALKESVPAARDALADAPPGGEGSRSSQRWSSKPNSESLGSPVDIAGPRK